MEEKFIKVCPRCGSTNINTKITSNASSVDSCNDCEFGKYYAEIKGKYEFLKNFPEIDPKELELFREEIKKNPIVK